jgi:hypothetical protein
MGQGQGSIFPRGDVEVGPHNCTGAGRGGYQFPPVGLQWGPEIGLPKIIFPTDLHRFRPINIASCI